MVCHSEIGRGEAGRLQTRGTGQVTYMSLRSHVVHAHLPESFILAVQRSVLSMGRED